MSVITHEYLTQEIKKTKTKLCVNCNIKAACYGLKNTNKYEYCRNCKLEDMIDIRHKTCICFFEKCIKRASYGFSHKKPELCCDHKKPDMIDLTHKKKCEFLGCTIRPQFGFVAEKPRFCSKHKLDGMEDIVNKRCNFKGCNKITPNYNYPNEKTGKYCLEHKLNGMINIRKPLKTKSIDETNLIKERIKKLEEEIKRIIKERDQKNIKKRKQNKKCEQPGCTVEKSLFGYPGKSPQFCSEHKLEGMEDLKNKRCKGKNCKKISPCFGLKGDKPEYCKECKTPEMIDIRHKTCICKFEDCVKRASYGFSDKKPERCFDHKIVDMNDLTHKKKCEDSGCRIRPQFGFVSDNPRFCSKHKLDGMEYIVNKRCIFKGCKITKPIYNFSGNINGLYCNDHKLNNMINVITKKCIFGGCIKIASFNFFGKKADYCSKHKEKGMINVNNKKCFLKSCEKEPTFNYKDKKTPIYCSTHKLKEMIDIKNKRCIYEGCLKITPAFNYKNEKRGIYCASHKLDDMIDVKHSKCRFDSCTKQTSYGRPGFKPSNCAEHREKGMIKRSNGKCKVCNMPAIYGKNFINLHCEEHKEEDEINMVENPCKSCGLTMILDKDEKCEYCNPETFKIATLVKQKALMDFLDSKNLKGDSTDKMIDGGICGKERPDRLYDFGDKIIVLECDEYQHKNRACLCEQTRMINISQSIGMPTYFIRFNPDDYDTGNIRKFPESISKRHKTVFDLFSSIKENKIIVPNAFCSVLYLYYDEFTELSEESWKILTNF